VKRVVILAYQVQAQGGCFDLFNDHRLCIGIKAIDPAAHLDGRIGIFGLVRNLHFGFVSFRARALYLFMALRAKLGPIAALKPTGSQIACLQHKLYQAADGNEMNWMFSILRGCVGAHDRLGF